MASRLHCALFGGVLFLTASAPAAAQSADLDKAEAACRNDNSTYGIDDQIAGCTALIESGQSTGGLVAKVLYLRGATRLFNDIQFDHSDENLANAIHDLSEAIQVAPQYASAYFTRGIAYNRKGDYDRAIADFDAALRIDSEWQAAKLQRDLAIRGKKGEVDVSQVYIDPHQPSPFQSPDGHSPTNVIPDADNADQARKVCETDVEKAGFEADQIGPDVRIAECSAVLNSSALKDEDRAAELDNRSIGFTDLKQYDRAIADTREAIRLNPNDWAAHLDLGVALSDKGDKRGAIAEFDTAIQLKGDSPKPYSGRGNAEADLGDNEHALADFDRAIELKPDDEIYLNNACFTRAILGRELDVARKQCDAAIGMKADAENFDSRGMVELKLGDNQAAWADYDRAIQLDPSDASYWYGRGLAALRLGKTADGQSDVAKAKSLDSTIAKTYAKEGVAH